MRVPRHAPESQAVTEEREIMIKSELLFGPSLFSSEPVILTACGANISKDELLRIRAQLLIFQRESLWLKYDLCIREIKT